MSCPSEYLLSPVSCTDQQVAAAHGHQILLREITFYSDMTRCLIPNQLWHWLDGSSFSLSQLTPLSAWITPSNLHKLGTFLGNICHQIYKPSLKHCALSISIPIISVQEFLYTYWESIFSKGNQMIPKASRWSLLVLIFGQFSHSSIIWQIWSNST